jgi:hypothetical protein
MSGEETKQDSPEESVSKAIRNYNDNLNKLYGQDSERAREYLDFLAALEEKIKEGKIPANVRDVLALRAELDVLLDQIGQENRENNEWPKGSPERTYYTLEDAIQNICLTYDLKCPERCKADPDWPRTTYAIYAAFITEPSLFSEAEDDEDDEPAAQEKLRRLKNKLGRSGYPEFRLNAALTDDQIKRLFEYAGTETGPLMLEAFRENMAGGLTRANKIKWFWFVNVLSFVIFHESQKEREAAEAAATEKDKREQRAQVIINGLRRTADLFGIQIPNLSAEWTGEKSFTAIQRRRGFKMDMSVYERILYQTQLREDGFEKTETADGIIWEKKFGRRRVRLHTSKIIAGDLSRRAVIAPILFASARGTYKPGPILFEEILDMIGQKECSQEERTRIREYLLAGEKTSLTVIETNLKNGKETWHDYAPLYKRFRWEGGTEGAARLFPIFNEDFPEVWKATKQYAYISAERMKGLPKERTEREHFVLDFFRLRYGMKCINRKMKAFLFEDAQLSEAVLKEWGIKKIKKTVSEWFELAKAEGLIREYYIDECGGRAQYLGQVIRYYPAKGTVPRIFPKEAEIRPLLNDIIEWIYEPDNKQYVKMPEAQARRELRNAIRELGVYRIREIWEGTGAAREGEGEDYSPWYPGTSRYMDFWNAIRADLAAQKAEGGGGK